MELEREIL